MNYGMFLKLCLGSHLLTRYPLNPMWGGDECSAQPLCAPQLSTVILADQKPPVLSAYLAASLWLSRGIKVGWEERDLRGC